ncbi:MAG: hypothetical protein EPN94_04180 [Nitrospirae bacterium]|nr:MAG: hypothetical protein EPN94_04180 [Nitrospirota bacterium]
MPAWKKAGNLVASTVINLKEAMDKDIPHVLIDIRPADEAKKEHIKGAVSIPLNELATSKDRFPADKKAPIIIYCSTVKASEEAFAVVRKWGYSNLSYLDGSIEAWKKAGNPVVSGDLATTIVYVPKPRPGEISIDEFKGIAETKPGDKLILDVRDVDEASSGMLIGARNIPTKDITSKLSDIPKDKEIITHCITGVRAEMAYHQLKEAGYKVRFLNADIKIDKDGKYEITKE